MSTKSLIVYQENLDKYWYLGCHHDGQPEKIIKLLNGKLDEPGEEMIIKDEKSSISFERVFTVYGDRKHEKLGDVKIKIIPDVRQKIMTQTIERVFLI